MFGHAHIYVFNFFWCYITIDVHFIMFGLCKKE
jgi:hypothetical protein